MSATELVNALEQSLITEAEAVAQSTAADLRDLYRKAILEMAPHLAANSSEQDGAC